MRTALIVTLMLTALTATARAADDRVGFVNVARVLAESEAGKQGSADLDQYRLQLVKAEADADAEAAKAPAATKKAKQDAAASLKAQRQQLMDQRNGVLIRALKDRIVKVVSKVASERKLDVVWDGAPLYARHDVTDDVIKRLNGESAPVAVDDVADLKARLAALEKRRAKPPAPPARDVGAALPNLDPRAMTATRPPTP